MFYLQQMYKDTNKEFRSRPFYFLLWPCPGWINYRKSPKSTGGSRMVYWSFNSLSLLMAELTVTAEVVLQTTSRAELVYAFKQKLIHTISITAETICKSLWSLAVSYQKSTF